MSGTDRLSYVLAPGLLLLFAAFAFFACGGTETPEEVPRPICYASHPVPDGGMVRNLGADEWADLVVRGYHEGQSSAQDCVGNPITWHATDDECDIHEDEDEAEPEAQELNEERVVVGRSDTVARKPVWVITHQFENGDGFGPVAITERSAEGIAVRALGTLRLPMDRARLRLRETGGQEILVADGERCPPEDPNAADQPMNVPAAGAEPGATPAPAEPTCLRYARLLPLVGDRLMNPEVRTTDNTCLGPAQVYLAREQKSALANGWERTFRLAASLEYRAGAVIIHEQVTAEDRDPRDPGRPARLFRTTDADRIVYVRRGGMRSRGISLFDRTVRAHGSTQLPIAEGGQNGEQSGSGRGRAARN